MTRATLGSCKSAKNEQLVYEFDVQPQVVTYKEYKMHDLVKVSESNPNRFDKVDYSLAKPFFPNNDTVEVDGKEVGNMYVITYGEVIYYSPDGNWGLIADGEEVLEFFGGSTNVRPFLPNFFPDLKIGAKVLMAGEMTAYKGNMQLSFVTRVETAPSNITIEPAKKSLSDYKEITSTTIANYSLSTGKHKQTLPYMMNCLKKVTGKVTSKQSFNSSKRSTLELDVGGKNFTIAYDYHIAAGTGEEQTKIIKAFQDITVGSTYTFYGTLRYNNGDDDKKLPSFGADNGVWQLTPFASTHIVK